MEYFTTTSKASSRATDCVVVGVYERGNLGAGAADIDAASKGEIRRQIKNGNVSGRLGRSVVLTNVPGVRAGRVIVVGLGKSGKLGVAQFRRAVAAAVQSVSHSKSKEILSYLTLEDVAGSNAYYLARHTVQTIGDVLYRFDEMKSGRRKGGMPLKKVGLAISKRSDADKSMRGAKHGDAIVSGMSLAKDLSNLPPNVCTPAYLARTAQRLAGKHKKLTTRIVNETEMKRLGMHSLLSVTAGTREPAKLIVMQYKGAARGQPVVLVG